MCCHSLFSLMTNSAQLTLLLVITRPAPARLELPSNAVSPALTTITETPGRYSRCTGVLYRGAGRISLILEQYTPPPPSCIPSAPGRSHDIVFLYNLLWLHADTVSQSAQVDGGQAEKSTPKLCLSLREQ